MLAPDNRRKKNPIKIYSTDNRLFFCVPVQFSLARRKINHKLRDYVLNLTLKEHYQSTRSKIQMRTENFSRLWEGFGSCVTLEVFLKTFNSLAYQSKVTKERNNFLTNSLIVTQHEVTNNHPNLLLKIFRKHSKSEIQA